MRQGMVNSGVATQRSIPALPTRTQGRFAHYRHLFMWNGSCPCGIIADPYFLALSDVRHARPIEKEINLLHLELAQPWQVSAGCDEVL